MVCQQAHELALLLVSQQYMGLSSRERLDMDDRHDCLCEFIELF